MGGCAAARDAADGRRASWEGQMDGGMVRVCSLGCWERSFGSRAKGVKRQSSRLDTIQILWALATRQDRLFSEKQTLGGRFGCTEEKWLQLQGKLSKFLSSGG